MGYRNFKLCIYICFSVLLQEIVYFIWPMSMIIEASPWKVLNSGWFLSSNGEKLVNEIYLSTPREHFKFRIVKSPCNILGLGCRILQVFPWRIGQVIPGRIWQPNRKILNGDLTMRSLKFSFSVFKLHLIY